jgi:hypothetical protein
MAKVIAFGDTGSGTVTIGLSEVWSLVYKDSGLEVGRGATGTGGVIGMASVVGLG